MMCCLRGGVRWGGDGGGGGSGLMRDVELGFFLGHISPTYETFNDPAFLSGEC